MEFYIWFIFSLAAGAIGVWGCRFYALKWGWLDHPNERSFHDNPTPRIGGIGMLFPVFLVFVALLLWPNQTVGLVLLGTLAPALLIAVLSFCDDRFDLSRLVRFSGHVICAGVVLVLLREVWVGRELPLFGNLLPVAVVSVLLMVWITGLTNSYNFMDGIDGISAVQGIVAVIGWISVLMLDSTLWNVADHGQRLILLALAGGLIGFLLLNWAPASIFLGDIGSTFLGFYFAVLPFAFAALGLPLARSLEAGVFFVWPFVADAGVTFSRRLIFREPIFDAHRSHLYQVLAATFPTRDEGHRITSLLFGLLALVGVGLYWSDGPLWAKLAVMAGLWVAVTAWTYGIRVSPDPASDSSDSTSKGRASLNESFTANQMPFDIYLSPPEITSTEKEWIAKALDSGYVAPVGPQVEQFEAGLSDYLGLEAIQAVSSGTAAIHLGLRALGVGPGDCVICPDLTFVASVNPVRYLGGEPVLVDIDPTNWAIDPAVAREAIRTLKAEGRVVRAMVIVHALGIPAPMDELMQLAEEEGVAVLEDCAGAFGTTVNGVSAGSFGDAATLSFNGNKILTTSGGGGLYLKDASKRAETRIWANQGKDAGALGYQHGTLGYNYRLSNICAAIGLGQLETVDRRLARKKSIFRGYQERFSEFAEIGFMPEPEHGVGNYWLSNISLDVGCESTEIVRAMRSEGIEAAPMWRPMSQQTVNAGLRYFGGIAGDTIFRKFLSLPCGSALTDTQLDFVAETLKRKIQIAR